MNCFVFTDSMTAVAYSWLKDRHPEFCQEARVSADANTGEPTPPRSLKYKDGAPFLVNGRPIVLESHRREDVMAEAIGDEVEQFLRDRNPFPYPDDDGDADDEDGAEESHDDNEPTSSEQPDDPAVIPDDACDLMASVMAQFLRGIDYFCIGQAIVQDVHIDWNQ